MTHSSDTPTTALTRTTTSLPLRHRCDGWTAERQVTFLRALASTHSVAQAARAAGMARQSAYRLRARLKGEPFDLAWHAALRCRFDALADAAMDRALNGVEVPHLYKGEVVHTSRQYDERLTIALLMMREKLGAPYLPSTHAGAAFRAEATGEEFGRLLARVETGPETWDEERRLAVEALYDEGGKDVDG